MNKSELNPPKKKSKFSLDNSQNKDNLSENKNIKGSIADIINKKGNSEITDKILNTEENKPKKATKKENKKEI